MGNKCYLFKPMSIILDSDGYTQIQQVRSDLYQVRKNTKEVRLGQWNEFDAFKEQEENEAELQVHHNSVRVSQSTSNDERFWLPPLENQK